MEAGRVAGVCARGLRGHLPESGPDQPGDRRGDAAVYGAVTFRQKRLARASQFALLAGGTVVGAFVLALTLGGPSIQDRVMTLFAANPISVYHNARGVQLDLTFRDLLYQYPFGAGLARWGMAAAYFQPTTR